MTTSALLRSSPRYLLALQSSRMASAPLSTASARMMAQSSTTSSEKGYIHPVYFELKEKQKAYQIDNGLRVSGSCMYEYVGAKQATLSLSSL